MLSVHGDTGAFVEASSRQWKESCWRALRLGNQRLVKPLQECFNCVNKCFDRDFEKLNITVCYPRPFTLTNNYTLACLISSLSHYFLFVYNLYSCLLNVNIFLLEDWTLKMFGNNVKYSEIVSFSHFCRLDKKKTRISKLQNTIICSISHLVIYNSIFFKER